MTITAYRLFKEDRMLHLAFILYRLKRDFGFSELEIANFTGVPRKDIKEFMMPVRKLLDAQVLRILSRMDAPKEIEQWLMMPNGHSDPEVSTQGYKLKDKPGWFLKELTTRRRSKPIDIKYGGESEKEWDERLKKESSVEADDGS